MLKELDSEAIGSDGTRVAAVPNGLGNGVGGEGREVAVEWAGSFEVSFDYSGLGIGGVADDGGKLFIEGGGYFIFASEGLVPKSDGLVGVRGE